MPAKHCLHHPDFKTFPKPFVIAIAGYVGSGKSTIAKRLSRRLEDAPILIFDHYEKYIEWPQNISQWLSDGADPDQIRIPKLKENLLSLLGGKPVTDPFDGRTIAPSNYILLEEPSGRERGEIAEYIDLVVYLDVPQDVCVTRLVERVINMGLWNTRGTFKGETKEDLVRQLDAVATWVAQYQKARSMYMTGSRMAQKHADMVVDGLKPIESITDDILNRIKDRPPMFKT